jgi:cysteinyl-tRNA synthetase
LTYWFNCAASCAIQKLWALSDVVRDHLVDLGVVLEDGKTAPPGDGNEEVATR